MMIPNFKTIFITSTFLLILLVIFFAEQSESTLAKRKGKKERGGPRPDGVAYNKKNFPTKCHVCRIMVEEINSSLKGGEAELTEEQKKEKKRKDRRKSKSEKKRERNMPILIAIEEVCNKMLGYIPQEEYKKNFRYVKTQVLKDVKSLIKSQVETEEAGDQLGYQFDNFRHPETNRLMSMCDEIINERENDLLLWSAMEEKEDLFDYLCKQRVFHGDDTVTDSCLDHKSSKDDLWTTAFDAVFEKHPELKNQEF